MQRTGIIYLFTHLLAPDRAQPEAREATSERLHVRKCAPLALLAICWATSQSEDESSSRSPF